MKKEKTIVFRHWRELRVLPDSFDPDALMEKLIEECLSKGYVPIHVRFERYRDHFVDYQIEPVSFDRAICWVAYAGKKQARIIYEKEKDGVLKEEPRIIVLKNE